MAYQLAKLGLASLVAQQILAVPHPGGQHQHLHERAEVTVTVTAGQPGPSPAAPAAKAADVAPKKAASGASSGSSSGNKAGLAYNDASLLSSYGNKFSFCWNWGAQSGNTDVPFVPMLKDVASEGAWSGLTGSFKSAPAVLGYNEPDVSGIDAHAAASKYPALMTTPFGDSNVLIGTPAPTSSAGVGSVWLDTFLGACSSCKIDFAAIHWYANKAQSAQQNADAFKSYITDTIDPIVSKYKDSKGAPMKIWVTEFGYVPQMNDPNHQATSPEDAEAFIKSTVPFLNQHSSVAKYSYFMVGKDQGELDSAGFEAAKQAYTSLSD